MQHVSLYASLSGSDLAPLAAQVAEGKRQLAEAQEEAASQRRRAEEAESRAEKAEAGQADAEKRVGKHKEFLGKVEAQAVKQLQEAKGHYEKAQERARVGVGAVREWGGGGRREEVEGAISPCGLPTLTSCPLSLRVPGAAL